MTSEETVEDFKTEYGLTDEEFRLYWMMQASKSVNGFFLVPASLLEKANVVMDKINKKAEATPRPGDLPGE